MLKKTRTVAPLLISFFILLTGCTEDNPWYCETSAECIQNANSGAIHKEALYCFESGHFCYYGCKSDTDCTGTIIASVSDKKWPAGLICNEELKICESTTQSDGSTDSEPTDVGVEISPDSGLPLGASCDNNEACENNQCVDGYCCESACIDECYRCNEIGNEGKCVAYTGGTMRDSECMVDAECQGACANGLCAYVTTDTKACGTPVCNATLDITKVYTNTCKDGACTNDTQDEVTDCKGYLCDATTNDCKTGCKDHSDCAATSVCDRSKAHENADGLGVCLDPGNVVSVSDKTGLNNALSNLTNTQTIRVNAGTYSGVEISVPTGKIVRLIGETSVEFTKATAGDMFKVTGKDASLFIQGIVLNGKASTSSLVNCGETTAYIPNPKVELIESQAMLSANVGISATNCDATIRRSEIRKNEGGGLELSKGTFVLTNNLIVGNGTIGKSATATGSIVGGVKIDTSATAVFYHNTVFGNFARENLISGVNCGSTVAQTLIASLIGENQSDGNYDLQVSGGLCIVKDQNSYEYSKVGNSSSKDPCGTTSYKPASGGVCVNQNVPNPLPQDFPNQDFPLKLDKENAVRDDKTFDYGCYEMP